MRGKTLKEQQRRSKKGGGGEDAKHSKKAEVSGRKRGEEGREVKCSVNALSLMVLVPKSQEMQ